MDDERSCDGSAFQTVKAAKWKLHRPSCVLLEGTSMSWRSAERRFAYLVNLPLLSNLSTCKTGQISVRPCEISRVRAMLLMGVAYIFYYYYAATYLPTAKFN